MPCVASLALRSCQISALPCRDVQAKDLVVALSIVKAFDECSARSARLPSHSPNAKSICSTGWQLSIIDVSSCAGYGPALAI